MKPRASAGEIRKPSSLLSSLDVPILEPPWHLRVTQSFLTTAINLGGRTKESKWRAASPPAIDSQESDGSALLRVLTDRLEMPPAWKKLTNFRVLIMTGRPKRLKTVHESGF
jgi:hypothetical protein